MSHARQVKVLLADRPDRLVKFGRKKLHRRYGERDRWLLSYCLSITEGIVKTYVINLTIDPVNSNRWSRRQVHNDG